MKLLRERRFTVRQKIQLPIILFIALLSLFMFLYFPYEHKQALTDSFRNEVRSLAQMVSNSVTIAAANQDWDAVRHAPDFVRKAPGVLFVAMIDLEGNTFSSPDESFRYDPTYEHSDTLIVGSYPVETSMFRGSVVVGSSTRFIDEKVVTLRVTTLWVALITLFLGTLFGMWVANLIVRPLSLLRLAAIKVGHGDLDTAVYRTSHDEIGDLATEFSKMITNVRLAQVSVQETNAELQTKNRLLEAERRQLARTLEHLKTTQAQLVQSEKMAALGQLIAGIAHEINTPLGAIRASISNIEHALEHTLRELPSLLPRLTPTIQEQFFAMVEASLDQDVSLSPRDERQKRRELRVQLAELELLHADEIADALADMSLFDDWQPFSELLRHQDVREILLAATRLALQQRNSRNIETAVERASKIVFALKSFSHRDQSGEMVRADLAEGIDTVITLYHNQLKHGIEVVRDFAPLPRVFCYPDELNQVWTNLIHNAIHAMHNQGVLEISLHRDGDNVEARITDSGQGIPEEIRERIFEPFFTTKEAGQGTGLGLDIVRRIIEKHEGSIDVRSRPGRTTFIIRIPLRTERSTNSAGPSTDESGRRM
ncbi:MAG: HAMP domain-containing protein [Bacteroidetes bacterium]|nr:HAMP domain-containing protein [Bacteroidota bacterium]